MVRFVAGSGERFTALASACCESSVIISSTCSVLGRYGVSITSLSFFRLFLKYLNTGLLQDKAIAVDLSMPLRIAAPIQGTAQLGI